MPFSTRITCWSCSSSSTISDKYAGQRFAQITVPDGASFNTSKLGSGKEMVERLTNLIVIFENKALDFSKSRAEGDDILGDAYEYLMRHFATERRIPSSNALPCHGSCWK